MERKHSEESLKIETKRPNKGVSVKQKKQKKEKKVMNERIKEEKEYLESMLCNNYADAKYKELIAKLEEYKSLLEYLTGFMHRNNWIKVREYENTLFEVSEWYEEVLANYDN